MITQYEFDILAHCAFRYALGRKSYVVTSVVNIFIDHVGDLRPAAKKDMVRVIKDAIANGKAGFDIDVADWKSLIEVIEGDEFEFYNDSKDS